MGTEGITTIKNQVDTGIKFGDVLVIKVHVQEACFMETFQRNSTGQIKYQARSCLQAMAISILKAKKSQSHQKKIFETLNESKQTSREVSTAKSWTMIQGVSASFCISSSCEISGLCSSVASSGWALPNPSWVKYLWCFPLACKWDFSVTPAWCCFYRYGRNESQRIWLKDKGLAFTWGYDYQTQVCSIGTFKLNLSLVREF